MSTRYAAVCLVAALAVATSVSGVTRASSHEGATGVVKERQELMKGMGGAAKKLGAMAKGEAEFDPAVAAEQGIILQTRSGDILALFPEGSQDEATSDALPTIWERHAEFADSAAKLEETSGQLVLAMQDGGDLTDLRQAFAAVGKSCGGCHEVFRKKQEN